MSSSVATLPQELLTAKEVAKLLKITLNALYILCHKRQIPFIKLTHGRGTRGSLRFDPAKVANWLAAKTQEPVTGGRS